jgi:hypothetical protein
MTRTPLLGFSLVAGAVALVSLYANAQLAPSAPGTGGNGPEPSRCLSDATIQVTATPAKVTWPQSTVVQWSVGLPNNCGNVHVRLNSESVGTSGSRTIVPPRNSTFTVTISETHLGVFGQRSASASVAVDYPPRVVIDGGTQNPIAVLLGALDSANPQQTVELCNVDIDLTGHTGITIGDNRSLIASPACARSPRRFGPRIFVTDERGRAPLFVIRGDNVLVSGFRLEGPTNYMGQGDRKEKGIVVSPFDGASPIRKIEISNMEIFHWSGLGIQVVDNVTMAERGRLFNTNPGAVRVKGNFFHHNRHGAGEGYGVESAAGAYVTIEQNVFDENRHGIAGGSRNDDALDYSGYTARDNLILSGGGLHCADSPGKGAVAGGIIGGIIGGVIGGLIGGLPGAAIGAGIGAGVGAGGGAIAGSWCWQTHQIDMHGDKSLTAFFGLVTVSQWCCGTAGETMIIERNTILYTKGLAIKIRGNPADKAVIDGNVFKHKNRGDAIGQNGEPSYFGDDITNPIDVRPNNVFGVDPTTELGSCDFFGDGQQDQFMATGVTWWAKSPVTGQWRYLNTMKERLSQLQLVRVDNDAVCDVAMRTLRPEMAPQTYSKSGTGPWQSRQVIVQ